MKRLFLNRLHRDAGVDDSGAGGDSGSDKGDDIDYKAEYEKMKGSHDNLTNDIGKQRGTNKLLKEALGLDVELGGEDLQAAINKIVNDRKEADAKAEEERRNSLTEVDRLKEDLKAKENEILTLKSERDNLSGDLSKQQLSSRLSPALVAAKVRPEALPAAMQTFFIQNQDFSGFSSMNDEDFGKAITEWIGKKENLGFKASSANGGGGGGNGELGDGATVLETLQGMFN